MGKDNNGKNLGKGFSQRKDGRYEARCNVKGTVIRVIGSDLKKVKKEFEQKKREASMCNGVTIDKGYKLEEWFDIWFNNCKSPQLKNDISRNVYKRKIKNTYIAILGQKRLNDVSQINVQMATNELANEKSYADRTITEALSALKDCFNVAIANGFATTNPCVSIYLSNRQHQKKEDALTPSEIAEFIDVIQDSFYYEQYMILLKTGLRIGEFSSLTEDCIDYRNKCIHVKTSLSTAYIDGKKIQIVSVPKTKFSVRDVPFIDDVEENIMRWQEKKKIFKTNAGNRWRVDPNIGETLFTTSMGSPSTRYSMNSDLKRVEDEINARRRMRGVYEQFPHLHVHLFRKTCCSLLYLHGVPVEKTQRILGHSSINITADYYTSISNDTLASATNNIKGFCTPQ